MLCATVAVRARSWSDTTPLSIWAFLNEAAERTAIKRNPFHQFSCFDTATLCGVAYGQTVLARAVQAAGLTWDESSAHSAAYDAEITADLFCKILNRFKPIFDSAGPQEWSDQPDESAADNQ